MPQTWSRAQLLMRKARDGKPLPLAAVDPTHIAVLFNNRQVYNSSLITYKQRLLLCIRRKWAFSRLQLIDVTGGTDVPPSAQLRMDHPECNMAQEDPRLFIHNDKLHCAFIGVKSFKGRNVIAVVSQMYAELDDDLKVTDVVFPRYQKRNRWEKNWQFFSHDNRLFAVYEASPQHRVLELDKETVVNEYVTPFDANTCGWRNGLIRGGAAPVLIGDEYYCFFHGSLDTSNRARVYTTGVYTFDAKPPFAVRRFAAHPLQYADPDYRPSAMSMSVIFPCGAFLHDGSWIISYGEHDRYVKLASFNSSDIEQVLRPV